MAQRLLPAPSQTEERLCSPPSSSRPLSRSRRCRQDPLTFADFQRTATVMRCPHRPAALRVLFDRLREGRLAGPGLPMMGPQRDPAIATPPPTQRGHRGASAAQLARTRRDFRPCQACHCQVPAALPSHASCVGCHVVQATTATLSRRQTEGNVRAATQTRRQEDRPGVALTSASDPPPTKWSDLRYVSTSRRTVMARKRYKPEEIVAKLRQVDVLVSQGQNMVDAIRQIGVSEVTYYRWRQEFGGLKTEQVKRLKDLELEKPAAQGGFRSDAG